MAASLTATDPPAAVLVAAEAVATDPFDERAVRDGPTKACDGPKEGAVGDVDC